MIRLALVILLLLTAVAVAQVGQVQWPNLQSAPSSPPPTATAKESVVYIYTGSTGYGDTF